MMGQGKASMPIVFFSLAITSLLGCAVETPLDPLLHYDTEVDTVYLASVNPHQIGVRFSPGRYAGRRITRIDYYLRDAPSFLRLYMYSTTPPDIYPGGFLLQNYDCPSRGADQWNSVNLTAPVTVPTADFWVAFYVDPGGNIFTCDNAAHAPDRNFVRVNDGSWQPWQTWNYDFNVRVYTEP